MAAETAPIPASASDDRAAAAAVVVFFAPFADSISFDSSRKQNRRTTRVCVRVRGQSTRVCAKAALAI